MPDAPKPLPEPEKRLRFYDLDWVVPFRDVVLVVGFMIFEAGIFLLPRIGLEAGLITTGAGLMWAAWRVLIGP